MPTQALRTLEQPHEIAVGPAKLNDVEFDGLCNELGRLAERVANLEMPEGEKQVVRDVLENARAQHFRVVLVSPFQGGKSTIFNTVCGGRELSPTGFGIKTSAAIAEARYLQEDTEEYAEVEWRTDAELLAGMEEAVLPALAASQASTVQRTRLSPATIRLADPSHRALLLQTITELTADPDAKERAARFDLLQAANLTVEHYDGGVAFRKHKRVNLPQATSWLAFPVDWTRRPIDQFRTTELAFLFLKRVIFHLKDPTLRRLRATLIDAPGLQASRWDSAITTDCIRNAHAVIFLLGSRGTAIGQEEIAEVEGFRRFDLEENVFYGYNVREKTRHLAVQDLLPHDLAALLKAGLRVKEAQFSVFNALLAYRARQCELLLRGQLPPATVEVLSRKAVYEFGRQSLPDGGRDANENARHLVERELKKAFEAFTGTDVHQISLELANQATEESNWEDLIARASGFVIEKKGEAILLDRGGRRLIKVLERLDGDLLDREKAAERDAGTMENEKEEALTALAEFEAAAEELSESVDRQLAEKGEQALLAELRRKLEKTKPLEQALWRVVSETTTPRYLAGRLGREAVSFAEGAITGWQASLNAGTSTALLSIMETVVKPAEQRLRKLSEAATVRAPGLLVGGATSLVTEMGAADLSEIDSLIHMLYEASFWNEAGDVFEDILGEVGLGGLASWLREKINDGLDMKTEWKRQIPTAVKTFKGAAVDIAEKVVTKQVSEMRQILAGDLKQAVRQVRDGYQRRIQQREADLEHSVEERERIGRESAERRRELAEVRTQVDEFNHRAESQFELAG